MDHSLAALLWLALLVPLAQATASVHGYAHVHAASTRSCEKEQAPPVSHCDLCTTAAAVAGGALVSSPPALLVACGTASAPRAAPAGLAPAATRLGYRSRAPPSSTR